MSGPYIRVPTKADPEVLATLRRTPMIGSGGRAVLFNHIAFLEELNSALHLIHAAERAGETVTWPAPHQVLVGGGEG